MKLVRNAVMSLVAAGALALTATGTSATDLERRPIGPRAPAVVPRDWPLKRAPHAVVVRDRYRDREHDRDRERSRERGEDWNRSRDRDRGLSRDREVRRVRVAPLHFFAPLLFGGILIDGRLDSRREYWRERDRLAWEDSETLFQDEEWVEFTLDCGSRGRQLWFEVRDGRARIDWAQIVFHNGDVQIVDFSERSIGPGVYSLLDFRDGRTVDHVRMVAQAATRQVRLILRMEK